MRAWAVLGLLGLGFIVATPAAAQRAECDFDYVIQAGDTLPDIAETAFGRRTYSLIYARNFGKIVNPANLPVGEAIVIPCLPGDASQTPDAAALQARMEGLSAATEAVVAAEQPTDPNDADANEGDEVVVTTSSTFQSAPELDIAPRYRFLTSSGQPPFSDESLRNGGMASELTSRAMRRLSGEDGHEIIFINDREKHLRELLLKGSFDVGFPWIKPSCEQIAILEENFPFDAWMCANFEFSEPFYEVVSGFFIRKGEFSSRSTWSTFATSSICRPSGEPAKDLIINGITDEFADIYAPKTARDCVELLMTGIVDAISADVFEIESAMFEMGVESRMEELPELSVLTTYNAVAPRGKESSIAALDALNQGMLELKLSGEWFRVVARHLAQN